jgi:hypothetical protein
MLGIPFAFTAPWILAFLVALPVLWWLLRLTPPAPRKTPFPALALLRGLANPEQTPARTPWWLLLLRFIIAALVIAAFAGPLIDPEPLLPGAGAVLIAIDNDWAAARAWDTRRDALHRLIGDAARENRDVVLLPTAPGASGEALQIIGPIAAREAYAYADRLAPAPWMADWKQAQNRLGKIDRDGIAYAFWLNSGLGGVDAAAFFDTLKSFDAARDVRVLSDPETPIYLLAPPKIGEDDDSFAVTRALADDEAIVTIVARGADGHVFAQIPVNFAAGAPRATALLDLPLDLHNKVARLEIEDQRTAASTVLLDRDWQHPSIGLIGDKAEETEHSLLSGLFYIDRALKPYADIHVDTLDTLLAQNMAVLIATDEMPPTDADIPKLAGWIKQGGVFVRFAGERLAQGQNPHEIALLPVTLRTGDRAMGGTMSWATPQKLQPFAASSPFNGLDIPSDLVVNRQVLAEPSADLADKSWAALEDGTPLVTAKSIGRGVSILFHVPARSEWSNLPLSGLFVDMLRRIADLGGNAGNGETNFSSLAPQQILDAFGNEQAPGSAVQPITDADFSHIQIGPAHPPGMYGNAGFARALNFSDALRQPEALQGISTENYRLDHGETDLQPWLLAAAFILLLMDCLISLRLRGLIDFAPRAGKAAMILLLMTMPFHTARAADDDKPAIELTSKTYLAYMETGNRDIDRISQAGLTGLARLLQRRTSLDAVGVTGVNPETDELAFFPLIYWPLTPASAPLSPQAAQHLNDYLHHGGMILLDSGLEGGGFLSAMAMQALLAGVDIPPLIRIPDNHVLRRSFYLLDEFPGRFAGSDLWLEPEEISTYDGVAAVIAGSGGWAGAWAIDDQGRPLFPCSPGGEPQRETAYRFGVNVVMYALTGNYKSDQMHAQALLERIGK